MTASIQFIQDLAVVMLVAGVAGWMFHRQGLSVIVGYLVAGMLVGPFSFLPLVEEWENIEILSQVGLVFLMFSIGMGLSVRRLRRMGTSVVVATAISALLVFNGWRLLGLTLGWSEGESLFLAGMLTVSSSAIIGKTLQDLGLTHQKSGQLALGVSVLEDVVAIIVLTVLISYVGLGDAGGPPIFQTLGLFGAFVIFLGVSGLLLVPRFLRWVSRSAGGELQTLMVAALLFLLALLAQQAGYSLALGAFLLGAIVAETQQRGQVERSFEGLRHIFATVFFVSIGMMIDFRALLGMWDVILLVSAVTIVARFAACGLGLLLVGNGTRESVRAGLALTPVGEFSFVIAQTGVAALVLEPRFFPLAVGVSLVTSVACPLLVKHSERIATVIERVEPQFVKTAVAFYRRWLARLDAMGQESLFWRLSRRRFIQLGVGVLFITGLLLLATPAFQALVRVVGRDLLFPWGTAVFFWTVLGAVVLVPLVAIWRNIAALAMVYAEMTSRGMERRTQMRFLVEQGLRIASGLLLFIWLWSFLPLGAAAPWVLAVVVAAAGSALFLFRRRIILIHSQFEVELEELLAPGPGGGGRRLPPWLMRNRGWDLNVKEFEVPDGAACAGRRIADLRLRSRSGCSVVAIDRSGYMIGNPGPETPLYPSDRILLLGNEEEIGAARKILGEPGKPGEQEFDDVRMEPIVVPEGSRILHRTLAELNITQATGVQVAGIKRLDRPRPELNPGGNERLRAGDELLILGTPDQVRRFEQWLTSPRGQEAAAEATVPSGSGC